MGDGTASRAAGVRLKQMRGSGLRCVMNRKFIHSFIHSFIHVFLFGPVKPPGEPRVLLEEHNEIGGGIQEVHAIIFIVVQKVRVHRGAAAAS